MCWTLIKHFLCDFQRFFWLSKKTRYTMVLTNPNSLSRVVNQTGDERHRSHSKYIAIVKWTRGTVDTFDKFISNKEKKFQSFNFDANWSNLKIWSTINKLKMK